MTGLLITAAVTVLLGTGGLAGWSYVAREHNEARSVTFSTDAFNGLHDGTYAGRYAGGMRGWRTTSVLITVNAGRVTRISLVETDDPGAENTDHAPLFGRVIETQSLDVDAVSGATLTSMAYLKAVEAALDASRRGDSAP